MSDSTPEPDARPSDDWVWGIVEVFGHRRHAGRVREEERFGAKMLRIDVPIEGDLAKGWTNHYYGGSAIFSFTPCDEARVMRANRPYAPPYLAAPTPEEYASDNEEEI